MVKKINIYLYIFDIIIGNVYLFIIYLNLFPSPSFNLSSSHLQSCFYCFLSIPFLIPISLLPFLHAPSLFLSPFEHFFPTYQYLASILLLVYPLGASHSCRETSIKSNGRHFAPRSLEGNFSNFNASILSYCSRTEITSH